MKRSLLAIIAFLAAASADARRTVAVIDFQNVNKEKNLEWLGTGIAETLTTQLSRLQEITVVERSRLHAALKEIKFSRSEHVDPQTASQVGKVVGADSIVLGSYQKFEDQVRLQARLVEVETGKVAAPTSVDGSYQKIFELQDALAANLSREITGAVVAPAAAALEVQRPAGMDAYQLFSDGVYFLRNDLIEDALTHFDQALQRDPAYGEAHFYRGMALAKLKRWDEAAAALKRALPRSEPVRHIKWSWDVPYEGHPSRRGFILVLDESALSNPDHFSKEEPLKISQQIIYSEQSGKNTVLHTLDLRQRSPRRIVIADRIPLSQMAFGGTSRFLVLQGESGHFREPPYRIPLHLISPGDGRILAQADVEVRSVKSRPFPMVWADGFYLMYPFAGAVAAIDGATGGAKWHKKDVAVFQGASFRRIKGRINAFIWKSTDDRKLHVTRVADGADLWVADLLSHDANIYSTEELVLAVEPGRRVAAFEIESGKLVADIPVQPASLSIDVAMGLSFKVVPFAIAGRTFYFASENESLSAVNLSDGVKPTERLLWTVPLGKDVHTLRARGERVYVGTNRGELLILDAASGRTLTSAKVAKKNLTVHDIGDDIILAHSASSVFGLDPTTASKKWEHSGKVNYPEPQRHKNVVILRSDRRQISVLNATTGTLLWQVVGKQTPSIHITPDSLFVAEETGLKEYSVESKATPGLTDKEVFTELAAIYLQQGNVEEGGRLLDKVTVEIDPDYPTARCLKAEVLKRRGDRAATARELVACLDLSGKESQRAQEILEELRRDHRLLWRARFGDSIPVIPEQLQDKIVTTGLMFATDPTIVALNASDGKVAWHHPGHRFLFASRSADPTRLLYVTGDEDQSQRIHIHSVNLASGESRKLHTFDVPGTGGASATVEKGGTQNYVQVAATDLQAGKLWITIYAFDAAGTKKLWQRTFEATDEISTAEGVRLPRHSVPIRAWGDYVAFAIGRELYVLRAADGKDHARYREDTDYHGLSSVSSEGVLYLANGGDTALAYDLANKRELIRIRVADGDNENQLYAGWVRDGVLYDTDGRGVFALDLRREPPSTGRLLWRSEAGPDRRYETIYLGERLLVERDDDVAVELDPATGKVLREHTLFWDPDSILVRGDTAFVLNKNGVAYSFQLQP